MIWRVGLGALLSYWWRHPGQAVALVLGLALATALWTGVQAINAEARASYDRATDALEQTTRPRLVPRGGAQIPLADYVALRRAGWELSPIVEGSLRLPQGTFTLVGLEPLTAPALPRGAEGGADGLRAFFGPPGQLLAHPETIAVLADVGDLPPRIASPDLTPGTLVGDIGVVSRLLAIEDAATALTVLTGQPRDDTALAAIAPGLRWQPPREGTDIAGLTRSFHLNLTAFGLLSFAVGLFIVHGSVGLAFEQRRGLFRTLRALGLTARTLAALLSLEMLLAALFAATLGIALGYLIAAALLPDVAATLRGLYGAQVAGSIALRPEWWLSGLAIALLGTIAATMQYVWQLARTGARATAIPRAWARLSEHALQRQAWVAGLLMLSAPVITFLGSGLVAGFAVLAVFLLGAALALPPAIAAVLALLERRAEGPLTQWLWADSRLQLPGLSLALMALLLAVAANIGVSTMVGSFRTTFTGWLDQRLAAELYLNAGEDAAAARIEPLLQERADAVLMVSSLTARLGARQGTLYGQADHATFRENWPLLDAVPEVWNRLHDGAGVLINEQLAHGAALKPGSSIAVDGTPVEILGIYSDYGNPNPQAIMGLDPFLERFPDAPRHRYALRLPSEKVPGLMVELQTAGLRPDQMTDQASLKAVSVQVFERTFAVTAALNVLTLSVAALAMLTSLLTLSALRLPQIAPVWAIGLTRRRLGMLELVRSAALALLTVLFALPVGLVLAWVLLAIVNVEAFGWRLPMRLFPGDWALTGGLALLASLLAAAWPAHRIATRPPADLLRRFANER